MYSMEQPSQSGILSPNSDPGMDSEDDSIPSRAQIRKSNKPLLEKKRRARINRSLEQLKGLVLEALKKDSARYSKLEKADILEMTVKHLREVQHHQMAAAMSVDPTVVRKFQAGYTECAQEVNRYLGTIDGLSIEVRGRLMQHLTGCITQPDNIPYPGVPTIYGLPSGSPPQSLPGMTSMSMHCALPFGGLAVPSPESPTLPVSSAHPHHQLNEYRTLATRHENVENIAPGKSLQRPLMEKTNNDNALNRFSTADINNMYTPPTKRRRVDLKQEEHISHDNRDNITRHLNYQISPQISYKVPQHVMEMNIKLEPVWRPW